MGIHDWNTIKADVVGGRTTLTYDRDVECDQRYKNNQQYVKRLKYRRYSDYVKVKLLGFGTRCLKDGTLVARKIPGKSVDHLFIKNAYPYTFGDDDIQHYLIWSLTPLEPHVIEDIVAQSSVEYADYVWFVNDMAARSIKDLWHSHVFLKAK